MPKNPHPPRGGASKKTLPPEEDTSYIVFGDGKNKKKKGESSKTGDSSKSAGKDKESVSRGNAKGTEKVAAGSSEVEAPKRPDTRTLIGGASWTGKLPVNLLAEHCQKQKWDKPDYRMHRDGDTYSAHVVLSKRNQKTQEVTRLPPFKIPPELAELACQPSAVEARHFAGAYTLFRVASAKNMHMMMPPTYKDLWKGQFTEIKKQDEKEGKAWMYEADPFLAFQEREKAKQVAAKEREKKQKERDQAKKDVQPGMPSGAGTGSSRNILKGWERVPKIELGKRTRREVERLIRRDAVWNPHGLQLAPEVASSIVEELTTLGFRKSHVEEAAEICKDREEIIEWLLIHVPEDDLPSWSLPEGYVAGASVANLDLKREGAVKRLATAGYAIELCEEAYDSQGKNEARAAAFLQARLLRPDDEENDIAQELADLVIDEELDDSDPWAEEQASLKAIYDKLYEQPSPSVCRIQMDLKHMGKRLVLQARKPLGPYPAFLRVSSNCIANLIADLRASLIRNTICETKGRYSSRLCAYDVGCVS